MSRSPIPVLEARDRILGSIAVMPLERVPFGRALGRVLCEDLEATRDQPPWDNSAMDGFAVRSADVTGADAAPVTLEVVEEIPAGRLPQRALGAGEAARIMTGAPLPTGADAVVRIEDTDGGRERVEIRVAAAAGKDVRRAGEDLRAGQAVLRRGTVIRPAEIGLIAAVGRTQVTVPQRPRVAILSTGDELVEPGAPPERHQIVNTNAYALAALVEEAGAEPCYLGIARDDPADLAEKLGRASSADVVLSIAGVSVGDHDHVKTVLADLGAELLDFWRVAMRPGHPLTFGHMGRRPVFGLPGNPVSSMVSFEFFVRPALRRMLHHPRPFRAVRPAVLEEDVRTALGRTHFLRAVVREQDGRLVARTTGPQGSGILRSMALANALLAVPAERDHVAAGEAVPAMLLDDAAGSAESRPF